MANLSKLILPVKDTITGDVTPTTFDLAGSGGDNTNFVGSRTEWNSLTQAEKDEYDTMDIYDEYNNFPIDQVPTQNSPNAVASGGVYSAIQTLTNNKADNSDIAIEEGNTFSKQYRERQTFYHDGVYYEAKTTIPQGTAWSSLTLNVEYKIANPVASLLNSFIENGTDKLKMVTDLYAVRFDVDSTTVRINFYPDATRRYSLYATTYSDKSSNYIALDYYDGSSWHSLFKKMSDS